SVGVIGGGPVVAIERIGQGDRGPLTYLGDVEALLGKHGASGKMIVGGNLSDAQVIVRKHFCTALDLYVMVSGASTPAHQGFFVAPARQRQNPARPGQTAIANVIDETIDALEVGSQHLRQAE